MLGESVVMRPRRVFLRRMGPVAARGFRGDWAGHWSGSGRGGSGFTARQWCRRLSITNALDRY